MFALVLLLLTVACIILIFTDLTRVTTLGELQDPSGRCVGLGLRVLERRTRELVPTTKAKASRCIGDEKGTVAPKCVGITRRD